MSNPSIANARKAIATAVETTGLSCKGYVLDLKNPPCAQVFRRDYDPRMVFSGSKSTYEFGVVVYTARIAEQASMAYLDRCAETTGDRSIVAAIQNETNWASFDLDYVQVVKIGGETILEIAGVQYLTIEFDVEVVW